MRSNAVRFHPYSRKETTQVLTAPEMQFFSIAAHRADKTNAVVKRPPAHLVRSVSAPALQIAADVHGSDIDMHSGMASPVAQYHRSPTPFNRSRAQSPENCPPTPPPGSPVPGQSQISTQQLSLVDELCRHFQQSIDLTPIIAKH